MKKKKAILKKLKALNKIELKDKLFPGYVFNKTLFRVMILVLFVYTFGLLAVYGFSFEKQFYYNCPDDFAPCSNPYFNESFCPGDESFCSTPYFLPGYSIGDQPPNSIKLYPLTVSGVLALIFLFNHLKFNRRKQ